MTEKTGAPIYGGPCDIFQTSLGKWVDNVVSISFDREHGAVSLP